MAMPPHTMMSTSSGIVMMVVYNAFCPQVVAKEESISLDPNKMPDNRPFIGIKPPLGQVEADGRLFQGLGWHCYFSNSCQSRCW